MRNKRHAEVVFCKVKKVKGVKFSLRFLVAAMLCCVLGECGRTSKVAREDSDSFRKHTFWSDKKTVFFEYCFGSAGHAIRGENDGLCERLDYGGNFGDGRSPKEYRAEVRQCFC